MHRMSVGWSVSVGSVVRDVGVAGRLLSVSARCQSRVLSRESVTVSCLRSERIRVVTCDTCSRISTVYVIFHESTGGFRQYP